MSENNAKAQFNTNREGASSISAITAPVAAERDPEFYYDDNPVVIQVESTLFRVHKHYLMQSETFSDMFSMPKGSGKGLEEGASPEHPIILSGVKAPDFRALLKVLYPVYFTNNRPKYEPEVIVPAFRLAHMWNFSDLRAHLLPFVKDALACVEKIVLARELGLQEWLVPAHVELCQRTESLTKEEVKKLGINSTVMVVRLREQFRSSQSVPSSGSFWNYCGSCGSSAPMHAIHGAAANCHRCGIHISSSTYSYRFPETPSGTTPSSGRFWNYCTNCGNSGHTWINHGAADCHKCGTHIRSGTKYYHFTITPSSTAPPSSDVGLESQVKKWVEAGCVTE